MMERLNPRSRSDTYGRRINRDHSIVLAHAVPWMTIMLGSLVPIIPIASAVPLMPPLGFMLLITWRLVRPGLLPLWAGFPLGLFDDLFSGQPFGSAILLWSLTMLAIEGVEARFPWRGFRLDWIAATIVIGLYLLLAALFSGANVEAAIGFALIPQFLLSALLFPLIARIVAALDRFRLLRLKIVA